MIYIIDVKIIIQYLTSIVVKYNLDKFKYKKTKQNTS